MRPCAASKVVGRTGHDPHNNQPHLADALAGVRARAAAALLAAEEQRSRTPVADVHGEQPGEFGPDRDLAALAALAVLHGDRPLPETDILDPQGHEFGDPGAGFERGLHHQAGSPVAGIERGDFDKRNANLTGSIHITVILRTNLPMTPGC